MLFNRRSSRRMFSSRCSLSRACFPLMERLEERINFGNPNLNTGQVPPNIINGGGCPPSTANVVAPSPTVSKSPSKTTQQPIRDVDGTPDFESTDLLSDGFGKQFGIVRSWTGLNESSQIGNGWMINSLPYLVIGRNDDPARHTGRIVVMNSGSRQLTFDLNGSTADSMYYEHQRLAYKAPWTDGDGNHPGEFSLTDTNGNVTTFYDLPRDSNGYINSYAGYTQQVATPAGMNPYRYGAFKSFTDSAGNQISTVYDGNGNLTALVRSDAAGVSEQFLFEYVALSNAEGGTATMISRISLQRRSSPAAPWTDVRFADYDYYTGDGVDAAYGRLGDLRDVSIFEAKTVSSITRSGTTATVTLPNHAYKTGDLVTIKGASQPEYDGQFTITVIDANTFTYTVSGSPASPATPITGQNISAGKVIDGKFYRYYKFHTDSYVGLHSPQNDPTKSGGTDTTVPGPSSYVNYDVVISGLRTVVEDDSFARLSADHGTVAQFSADDPSVVDPYAQHTFQYERYNLSDDVQNFESQVTRYRVIQETAQGDGCSTCASGQGTYRISYLTHGAGDLLTNATLDRPNRWVMRTTEYLPDDTNTPPTRNLNPGDMTMEDDLGFVVTVQWPSNGFIVGERVTVSGADQSAVNGTFAISSVSADSFTYNTTDDPGSGTATGNITVTNLDHQWADNDQNITYTNVAGEVMMSVLVDRNGTIDTGDDKTYTTYYRYDAEGRLILTANPSAIATTYDPANPSAFEQYDDLAGWNGSSYANLKSNDGLVQTNDYYNTTA